MKKLILILFVVLGITNNIHAQVKRSLSVSGDSKTAIKLNFDKYVSYGPTVAPVDFGKLQEIKGSNDKSCFSFEKEHNTAWYYFDIKNDGNLVIDIIPTDTTNDYDFMIFKYTDTSFFNMLVKQKIKPVRSNVSRSGKTGTGVTGLKSSGKANLVHAGPGETFSKSLEVKKGERYYLVLDNVYPKGFGHTIKLGYEKNIQISGIVLNEENKPIQAEVTLSDEYGHDVIIKSDQNGKYNINANLWGSNEFPITFLNEDNYFIPTIELNADSLMKENNKLMDLKTVLPKLRGGKSCVVSSIHFDTSLYYYDFHKNINTFTYKPDKSSLQSIKYLTRLMKKNPKMTILIEGHRSSPPVAFCIKDDWSGTLAAVVYNILLSNGIDESRMQILGCGSLYMLYPKTKVGSHEDYLNRRVEIKVFSLD